jgi:hypothetical protein
MPRIIVSDHILNWENPVEGIQVVPSQTYLTDAEWHDRLNLKIINLCDSYRPGSAGQQVSALARANEQFVIPRLDSLPGKNLIISSEFTKEVNETLSSHKNDLVEFSVYFGFSSELEFTRIGALLFSYFAFPVIRASFSYNGRWLLESLNFPDLSSLEQAEQANLLSSLELYLVGKKIGRKNYFKFQLDLAILVNGDDLEYPSNAAAIQKIMKQAELQGFNSEIINKNDAGKLQQFDTLLIRELYKPNLQVFEFAKKAEREGVQVINPPDFIQKAENKIYLHSLMSRHQISVKSLLLIIEARQLEVLQFPARLMPSMAYENTTLVQHAEQLKEQLEIGNLLLVQPDFRPEKIHRLGIFQKEILFYELTESGYNSIFLPVPEIDDRLLKFATICNNVVLDGFYELEILEQQGHLLFGNVNSNPVLRSGYEDQAEGDLIYEKLMHGIVKKLGSNA